MISPYQLPPISNIGLMLHLGKHGNLHVSLAPTASAWESGSTWPRVGLGPATAWNHPIGCYWNWVGVSGPGWVIGTSHCALNATLADTMNSGRELYRFRRERSSTVGSRGSEPSVIL